MTSFFQVALLTGFASILSSCCAGFHKAVRIHNLTGDIVFQENYPGETEEISRFGYESFLIPNSAVCPGTDPPIQWMSSKSTPIQIRDSKGVLYRYLDFDWQNYTGPTHKKWMDPNWTCIEKRYRAVLQPDMTIKFGSQIIRPKIGEVDEDGESSEDEPKQFEGYR